MCSIKILIGAILTVASYAQKVVTLNPYGTVDWAVYQRHLVNLHTHTTLSDGAEDPDVMIDEYIDKGFSALAITDHNNNTWPWTDWDRNPDDLDIFAIRGVEGSRHDHSNQFFTDYEGASGDIEVSLEDTGDKGGLAQINHPGRYNREDDHYAGLFRDFDHLVGMEIYNQGDRYSQDRDRWDRLLTLLMPDRAVWGISNDDSHNLNHVGRNFQVMLLPGDMDETGFRNAFTFGEFYAVYDMSGDNTRAVHPDSIVVTATEILIYPESLDTDITWISGEGQEVYTGAVLNLQETQDLGNYVRAVIDGADGAKTLLQPFGLVDSVVVTAQNISRLDFKVSSRRINSQVVEIHVKVENQVRATLSDVQGRILHRQRVSRYNPIQFEKVQGTPSPHIITLEFEGRTSSELMMLP